MEVELESTDVCPSFTLRTMLIHNLKVTFSLTFSDSSWSFDLTTSLASTDESAPAGEALPVPEVGERGGAGERAGSARPDQGDREQVWPDGAQEQARPHPLQVRRVQGTGRVTEAVGVWLRPCRAFSVLPLSEAFAFREQLC